MYIVCLYHNNVKLLISLKQCMVHCNLKGAMFSDIGCTAFTL